MSRTIRQSESEVRPRFDAVAAQLRAAGATDDEVAGVQEHWDELGPDERLALRSASRSTLVALLADHRADDEVQADWPDPAEVQVTVELADGTIVIAVSDIELDAAHAAYEQDKVADMNVERTVAWMGTDVARGRVAHDYEWARGEQARKGVIDPATKLITAASTAE